MVYQMPYPGKEGVFVASSYQSQDQAQRELQSWAAGHGYRFAAADRTFTVYGHEQQPRQWVLLTQVAATHGQSSFGGQSSFSGQSNTER